MGRWAILFGAFILTVVILADTRRLGVLGVVYDFPFGDKVGHFMLYGILSLLVNLAVFEAQPAARIARSAVLCSLILAIPIGLEELSQRWFPARTSSAFDLAASYLGVSTFAWLAVQIQRRRSVPE